MHQLQQQPDGDLQVAAFTDQYNSIMTPDDFVDSSILQYIWPQELDDYRICVIAFTPDALTSTPTSFTVYTPTNNVDATLTPSQDIVLRLYKNHFSLLTLTEDNSQIAKPIDRLIQYAANNNIFCDSNNLVMSQGYMHNTLFQTLNHEV